MKNSIRLLSSLSLLLLLVLVHATTTIASAVITVQGKLVSITSTDYVIETKSQIYSIKRQAVTKEQASQMERTEIPVALTVPFNAVDSVRTKKN